MVRDRAEEGAPEPEGALGEVLSVSEGGGGLVLALHGEIDAANAPELERVIAKRRGPVTGPVAVDLSDVSFLDSAGIELLFSLARALLARGGELRVIAPREAPVRRILKLCDLGSVARVEERVTGT